MMLLSSISLPTVRRLRRENNSRHLGRLFVPAHRGSVEQTIALGIPCAGDQGAFGGFEEARALSILERLRGQEGLLFFPARDVVGDAVATRGYWAEWSAIVRSYGLRVAYVLQDGEGHETVEPPWGEMSALFIGGKSARWKVGPFVRACIVKAKALGLWVHMGRVNSLKRIRQAFALGCDSVDGSGWGKYADTKLPAALALLNKLDGIAPTGTRRLDSFGGATA